MPHRPSSEKVPLAVSGAYSLAWQHVPLLRDDRHGAELAGLQAAGSRGRVRAHGVSYADVLFTKLHTLIVCAAIAAPLLAAEDQPSGGSWKGALRDAHGAAIAGAVVRVQSAGTKAAATTGSDGQFAFAALAVGEYSVSVDYQGSTATCSQPVRLAGGAAAAVLELSADGALSLLAATESRAGTGGEQLSAKAVSAMPLNKRDFSQLLLLAAGTMTDTNGASNFTSQFAVNGQRGTAAVFAMDGADSTDPEMGGATFTNFNVDAVREIRSSSGWMPAEIGRGAAGFTDIVTKSGANSVHGAAFEFLRNAALDARNFFDHGTLASPGRIPPFIRNEFGLAIGGPVAIPNLYNGRNRTFFFAEYQGFRQVLSATEVLPVPTAAERQGQDTTAYPGDTLIVPVDSRIAPVLARYPLPNEAQGPYGARTWAGSSKVTTVADQFSARIDHNLSSKSKLFGRFTMENATGPDTNPDQTALSPEFAVGFLDRQRNAVITLVRTPSPASTQEFSVSATRATPSFPTPDRARPLAGVRRRALRSLQRRGRLRHGGIRQPVPGALELHADQREACLQGRRRDSLQPRYHAVRNGPQRAVPVRRRGGVFARRGPLP